MTATESGVWTSFFGQSDLDLTSYIPQPQTDTETFVFPKGLCDDSGADLLNQTVDDLIRALGGGCATTPPPSEFDVQSEERKPAVPVPVLQATPPSTPEHHHVLDVEEDGDMEQEKEHDCSTDMDVSVVPRHKRPAHKRAEVKRRGKIKTSLDDLRDLLPPIHNQRKSESLILANAADHCRQLKDGLRAQEEEKARLRAQIADLTVQIETRSQFAMDSSGDEELKDLPAMGLNPEGITQSKSMDKMYGEYVKKQTQDNWKFWIFSFMMRPLYETYTTAVSSATVQSFTASVRQWTEDTLGLVNLRSEFTKGVLRISKETNILTHPDDLQNEALKSSSSAS